MRIRLLMILLVLSSKASFSQLDREFWFAVPEVVQEHADRPIKLHISANNRDCQIKISIPANESLDPVEVLLDANTSTSVDLTDWIDLLENTLYNSPQNKGLFIESDELISVYYEVLGSEDENVYNTDIFVLKGSNALGEEFYTPFQNIYDNVQNSYVDDAWSSIDVVAVEDNTVVTFELTSDREGNQERNFSVALNKGQTYSVRNASRIGKDRFFGSKVTSDKPIAITIKDDSMKKENDSSYDLVGDQLIPISLIGDEYILLEGENFVLATQDETIIELNGIVMDTLDEGEMSYYNLNQSEYLQTSHPVYVLELTETSGEYGGAILPHISCTGSYKVSFNRATNENLILIILVKNGGQNHFELNDDSDLITGSDFNPVAGTNGEWYEMRKTFNASDVPVDEISKITNSRQPFHVGLINGGGSTGSRYGYFSNFNILDLGINFDACDNTVLEVEKGLDSYIWSTGDTTSSIDIDSSGLYWVEGTEGVCTIRDTIEVVIKPGISYELAADTFLCGDSVTLKGLDTVNVSYLWSTGDTIRDITVTESGEYSLKITNQYDCSAYDEIIVSDYSLPEVEINDTLICDEAIVVTLNLDGVNMSWVLDEDTLSTEKFLYLEHQGNYLVSISSKCGVISDSFWVGKRNLEIPNIYTPNDDGVNDEFSIDIGKGQWVFELGNRWGKMVFESDNFDGKLPDLELNDGIYYYVINDVYCGKVNRGWIQIVR